MILDKLVPAEKDVMDLIRSALKNNHSLLLTYLNQNNFNICFDDVAYKELLNNKFSVYPDGIGVFLLNKFLGYKNHRIDATEMNNSILRFLIGKQVPLAIIGGHFTQKFIEEQAVKHKINFCAYQDGYFPQSMIPEIINKMQSSRAQVLMIGMGVPAQEIFASRLHEMLGGKVIICVGNFFEYYFGTKSRAPVVFRKAGLEWAFRMASEPGRLWSRYLIGIPKFIYRAFRIKLSSKKEFA